MKRAIFIKQFTTSFTAATYDRIKAVTDQKKISMGEWVRDAVEKALADEKLTNMNNNNILKGENEK